MIKTGEIPIRIVLVRPRNPNNIGAVARAMKNFGFADLVIVAPHAPVWEEARRSAIGAVDLVERARVVENLVQGISDCSMVIGTVDPRRGKGITTRKLVEELSTAPHQIALVFGSEKSGLTKADLSYCHRVASIPTSSECPSMNLGQAVAIFCYELARIGESPHSRTEGNPLPATADIVEVESLLEQTAVILGEAGFLKSGNERKMKEKLRQSLLRMRLTSRDVTLWRGAVGKILSKVQRSK